MSNFIRTRFRIQHEVGSGTEMAQWVDSILDGEMTHFDHARDARHVIGTMHTRDSTLVFRIIRITEEQYGGVVRIKRK